MLIHLTGGSRRAAAATHLPQCFSLVLVIPDFLIFEFLNF
jgi:hypothetical protein